MTIDHLNVDDLKARPDDGPVTMLNLMRFRERHQDPTSTDLQYAARINHYDSVDAFVAAHSGSPWFVSMVGFVAGLPFMFQMVERERQIGQTGVVCRPKVAIVCGASGAFHFVVGIQGADTVIAINSDPEAPIFDFADYCIVGDVFSVVPALTAALRAKYEVSYA